MGIFKKILGGPEPPAEKPTPGTSTEATQTLLQAKQANETTSQQKKSEAASTTAQTSSSATPVPHPEAKPMSKSLRPEMRPHAFVVMPFGKKKGSDGSPYDFNAIYTDLIKPTLESAGFEAFRADESTTSGDILTDMFQELLLADLVLCDMSIDNANAFYELGIRHAFRKRGIVHIQAGRAYMPFDVFNVRTIPYHVTSDGVPDPDTLEKDKQTIARVCRDTWSSDPDAIHSPIFNLLTGLIEPDRKTLRTPLATGFWREYREWQQRMTVAQRQRHIGDILLLTEEITNPLIKEEAVGEAGKALANMGRNELALQLYRKGLEINPRNLTFRRQEAFHLNRLGRVDEAIVKLEAILTNFPNDTEAIAYVGRIYKEIWIQSWKWVKDKDKRLKTAFESYHWAIKGFQTYLKGYYYDLNQYYPGVNALTLGIMITHLADQYDDPKDPDPDITEVRELLSELHNALLFALGSKATDEKADYWTLVSLAELQVLTAESTTAVARAYRKALTSTRGNMFFLESSLQQLEMLHSLDIRTTFVETGIRIIHEEIRRSQQQDETVEEQISQHKESEKEPEGNAFLFAGYMIDYPGKEDDHFPPEKESAVRLAIRETLEKCGGGPEDVAFTPGVACGSELIFIECCVEKGIPVRAYMPVPEANYVSAFVSPGGDAWTERFYRMRNHPLVEEFYQPDHVGDPRPNDDVNERNNRWALYSSLERGVDKVRLIALWDGKGESPKDLDGYLVKHMVDLMRVVGGQVEHINSLKLFSEVQPISTDEGTQQPKKHAKARESNSATTAQ